MADPPGADVAGRPRACGEDVRLHVVTGKGGTGKTTVAAALALTLASSGRKVLLAEVEGRQGIAAALDVAPLPDHEQLVTRVTGGGEIWGLAVDARAALMEYLGVFHRLGRAGAVLQKIGAIDFATTIAPGVRDVIVIGKIYEAARRTAERRRPDGTTWAYDAVVLDAPPTGRITHVLGVNEEVAGLAKVGLIRRQAESITGLLRSSACAVHVVTLLEEMPVQETHEVIADLARMRVPSGAVVVNQVRPAILSDATQEFLDRPTGPMLDAVGDALQARHLDGSGDVVRALADEARDHAERAAVEDGLLDVLDAEGSPMLLLPHLDDGADPGGIRVLAQQLADQAVWP